VTHSPVRPPALDHSHPLAVFEDIEHGNGEREPVANSWGSASVMTYELADQGAAGIAAENITAILTGAGHQESATKELIRQVLAATDDSQAQLRKLQQQIAEAIHQACEQSFGEEGNR
jgi:hypothetical protein